VCCCRNVPDPSNKAPENNKGEEPEKVEGQPGVTSLRRTPRKKKLKMGEENEDFKQNNDKPKKDEGLTDKKAQTKRQTEKGKRGTSKGTTSKEHVGEHHDGEHVAVAHIDEKPCLSQIYAIRKQKETQEREKKQWIF